MSTVTTLVTKRPGDDSNSLSKINITTSSNDKQNNNNHHINKGYLAMVKEHHLTANT